MTSRCEKCDQRLTHDNQCTNSLCTNIAVDNSAASANFDWLTGTSLPIHTPSRIELPAFIQEDVRLWWAQVEARLNLAGIKDDLSRFRYVIAGLPLEVIKKVSDLVYTEPLVDPFGTLRTRIINEFEPTDSAKLRQLLEGCQLGDRLPSELLREMRKLAQDRLSDDVLRELFFKRLPTSLTTIFLTTGVTDLEKAAQAADTALRTSYLSGPQIAVVSPPASTTNEVASITARIDALTRSVQQLMDTQRQIRRNRSSSRGKHNQRSRSPTPRRFASCYYHYRFGEEARNCKPWCEKYSEWKAKNPGKSEN